MSSSLKSPFFGVGGGGVIISTLWDINGSLFPKYKPSSFNTFCSRAKTKVWIHLTDERKVCFLPRPAQGIGMSIRPSSHWCSGGWMETKLAETIFVVIFFSFFPIFICHFGAPQRPFWTCRQCGKLSLDSAKLHTSLISDQFKLATN